MSVQKIDKTYQAMSESSEYYYTDFCNRLNDICTRPLESFDNYFSHQCDSYFEIQDILIQACGIHTREYCGFL
jgi:hypothetical protein